MDRFGWMWLGMALVGAVAVSAQTDQRPVWALLLDVGAPPGRPAPPSLQADGEAFFALLQERFHADAAHLIVGPPPPLPRQQLRKVLRQFAEQLNAVRTPNAPEPLVWIYLRGTVTRPPRENAIYLFTGRARPEQDVVDNPEAIPDRELRKWIQELEPAIVLTVLDFQTPDESLGAFFAARTELADGRLVVVARRVLPRSPLRLLTELLAEGPDPDRDGLLRWEEVQLEFQRRIYAEGTTPDEALVGGTGDPDLILLELPARLYVTSMPVGAEVLLDGQPVGETPYVQKGLRLGATHTVQVRKLGYRLPEPETVSVEATRGVAYVARFPLEPVQIRLQITSPDQEMLGPIVVVIPETSFRATLPTLGEHRFSVGETPLSPGSYRVIGATPDDRFFGTAEFTYTGYADVAVTVELRERSPWEVAVARYQAGFHEEALAAAEQALREGLLEPPELPEDLATWILERWADRKAPRPLIVRAQLLEQLGRPKEAQRLWRAARKLAPPDSPERELAAAHIRFDWSRLAQIVVLLLVLTGLVAAGVSLTRRRRAPE